MSLTLMLAYIGMGAVQGFISQRNMSKNKELLDQQTACREKLEQDLKRKDFDRARKEMALLHQTQLQLDEENWKCRLESMDVQFQNNRKSRAYAESIKNWPLLVPPFIMRGSTFSVEGRKNMPPQLIIGPSLNQFFDHEIMSVVEERLSLRIAKNWNDSSLHQVIYHASCWKNNLRDLRTELPNIKSQLQNLPVLAIQPVIDEDGNMSFSYSHWGFFDGNGNENISAMNCIYCPPQNIIPPICSKGKNVENVNQVSETIAALLELFVGYAVDLYYWNNEGIAPLLPQLVNSGKFSEVRLYEDELKENYTKMCNDAVSDEMLYYHPELSLRMLTAVEGQNKDIYNQRISSLWDNFISLRTVQGSDRYDPMAYTLGPNDIQFLNELQFSGIPGTEPALLEPLLISAQEEYFYVMNPTDTIFGL